LGMSARVIITAPYPTFEETAKEFGLSPRQRQRLEKEIERFLDAHAVGGGRRRAAPTAGHGGRSRARRRGASGTGKK
jgi:hypothetical protein